MLFKIRETKVFTGAGVVGSEDESGDAEGTYVDAGARQTVLHVTSSCKQHLCTLNIQLLNESFYESVICDQRSEISDRWSVIRDQ